MVHCIISEAGGYHRETLRSCCASEEARTGRGGSPTGTLEGGFGVSAPTGSRSLSTADATRQPEMSSMAKTSDQTQHLVIRGELRSGYEKVLTPGAVAFIAELERKFGPERRRLLARRADTQRRLDTGGKPDFLP